MIGPQNVPHGRHNFRDLAERSVWILSLDRRLSVSEEQCVSRNGSTKAEIDRGTNELFDASLSHLQAVLYSLLGFIWISLLLFLLYFGLFVGRRPTHDTACCCLAICVAIRSRIIAIRRTIRVAKQRLR